MLLKKWENIPDFMKNEDVRNYYDILNKKKGILILKRLFDIIVSLLLIILLSPIMLFVAVWIKLDSKGPVFYRQVRVTQYGKTFRIFKFRTMITNADKIGSLVTTQGDSRITKVGNKIRKSRLDEIPQVFNVFIGQMSFVGARPEVEKYVVEYTSEMLATLLLPAGVTSLASIEYKNEDEIINQFINKKNTVDQVYVEKVLPKKMEYNLKYLVSFGFMKDVEICVRTII